MIIWSTTVRAAAVAAFAFFTVACDSGEPSKTADEFAADSALAADLALANRDTLLVDSIGAYREPDAAERDTTASVAPPAPTPAAPNFGDAVASGSSQPNRVEPAPAAAPPPPQPSVVTSPAPAATAPSSPPPTPSTTTSSPTPRPPAPRLTGTRACSSPTLENQSECIRVSIAAGDARLNRVYRALITEMRRQEGVPGGAKDPPSVQRLRVAQRQWLVYRDNECRKRGRGKEGALWARPRARCLSEFSARRANELADDFVKLTAH
jgi:uncharacterized protein YecT (DUF1311 family)